MLNIPWSHELFKELFELSLCSEKTLVLGYPILQVFQLLGLLKGKLVTNLTLLRDGLSNQLLIFALELI